MKPIYWEECGKCKMMEKKNIDMGFWCYRARVPGGWFIRVDDMILFYPDPEHQWDGSSLD